MSKCSLPTQIHDIPRTTPRSPSASLTKSEDVESQTVKSREGFVVIMFLLCCGRTGSLGGLMHYANCQLCVKEEEEGGGGGAAYIGCRADC
jgi:hypothetical protein